MDPLPEADVMFDAVRSRDASFDGAFFFAVATTGVFCRPGCGSRTPRRENVEFFPTASAALHAGYRPCLRCAPLGASGSRPEWVESVLRLAERHDGERLGARDLADAGIDPVRAARWFKRHFGMTFQAWHRARRVGTALRDLRSGAGVARAGAGAGYLSDSGFRDAFTRLFGRAPRDTSAVLLRARWIATPLGPLLAAAGDAGLCLLEFVDRRGLPAQLAALRRRFRAAVVAGDHPHLDAIQAALARYFAGTDLRIDVPIAAPGTPFQEDVWRELRRIPAGTTRSYADIARAIGRPAAVRAVAQANGRNRIAIVIPCHRVIGADGRLSGYGGGVWRKEWLLRHEAALAPAHAASGLRDARPRQASPVPSGPANRALRGTAR